MSKRSNNEVKNIALYNTFVFRSPYFSFSEFIENLNQLENNDNHWLTLLKDLRLQEAIYLASPILYNEITKYLAGTMVIPKEVKKLKLSVLRYYTRMSTRCTPFGLFAGISIGEIGDKNEIRLDSYSEYKRHTRLDMNYLCNLLQSIAKSPGICDLLYLFPNNSIYRISDQIRYIEYYYRNTKRIHNISAIDHSCHLQKVLHFATKGATTAELANLLIDEEISFTEAKDFIDELISSQILVSELEPSVTGDDILLRLLNFIHRIGNNEILKGNLACLKSLLQSIDGKEVGSTLPFYQEIGDVLKEIKVEYDPKYLFQTDLYKPTLKATLDNTLTSTIQETVIFLNKITLRQSQDLLAKFVEKYIERYRDIEMPLLQVLDTETGIGYQNNHGDICPLLDGYVFPMQQQNNAEIKWNRVQSVMHKKLINSYKTNAYCIEIEDIDFDFIKPNWDDLPITMSVMCEFFSKSANESLIYVHYAGGSSAANLLGRFCHLDKELENYTLEICKYEQTYHFPIICAEIVHLPESRIGNILFRPKLRQYEIPYLCKSSVETENNILLSDLFVSIKNGRIILRSKKLNTEILPLLSTAHNYGFNSLPVYQFLCDMQTQQHRAGIGFNWGNLEREYDFLPRVKYKNAILALARWIVQTKDFTKILGLNVINEREKEKENSSTFLLFDENVRQRLQQWRTENHIPRYVVFPEGDNELFVDMNNMLSVQTLYSIIRKLKSFTLMEFPFDKENSLVKNNNGEPFTNEFIFGLYLKKL